MARIVCKRCLHCTYSLKRGGRPFFIVDTLEALIIDIEQRFPIAIIENSLGMCGGDDATFLQVSEVRELAIQDEKKGRTRRKIHE